MNARKWRKQRERMRQMATQRLVSRVADILIRVGLAQPGSSVAGGWTKIGPEVISVDEKPMRLTIQILPGQIPDDFVKVAPRIAYALDVAEVHVDELGPSLIQLRLVPKIRRSES
jgi:hypothetical protein